MLVHVSVYVFLGGINGVVDLMTNLYDRGLLDTGEYVVIFVDHGMFDAHAPLKYFRRKICFGLIPCICTRIVLYVDVRSGGIFPLG